jgi:hypothetical protein
MTDDRDPQQEFHETVAAQEEYEGLWICPYCGNTMGEEDARFRGCCGEVHCLEPNTQEWLDFIQEEF